MATAARSGHAVLLVGVQALEKWVRERTAHYDRSFVSTDPTFMHAHITILAPCPVALGFLHAVAAAAAPFDFALHRIDVFPDGVIHLVPEPSAHFGRLTDVARAAAPDYVPYWGRFDPTPHLTLDRVGEGVTLASTADGMAGLLPASGRAERLLLTWWEAGNCRVLASADLSGSPN